jgi:hypothetical protein
MGKRHLLFLLCVWVCNWSSDVCVCYSNRESRSTLYNNNDTKKIIFNKNCTRFPPISHWENNIDCMDVSNYTKNNLFLMAASPWDINVLLIIILSGTHTHTHTRTCKTTRKQVGHKSQSRHYDLLVSFFLFIYFQIYFETKHTDTIKSRYTLWAQAEKRSTK